MSQKILNKRKSASQNGETLSPSPQQLDYGELAINYHEGNETFFIKNSNNDVVSFSCDNNSKVHLPSVTSSDNGKILQVVNGQFALVVPVTIYSGDGTPSSSIGNNGDIYLQTS